ncbi:MAG: hypothetical protein KDC38_11890 [Planctomycetes bacterium]|nr:hypothetical protein [Planctomycetota bacterium]
MLERWTDRLSRSLLPLFALVALPMIISGQPAGSDEIDSADLEFIRLVRDGEDSGRLQTAVTTLTNDEGQQVVLYSAVHIGDASYYRALQREFTTCDAVLYELIAQKGLRPEPGERARGLITIFQRFLQRALALEFQLDGIDYSVANFVHADMTPEQFARSQEKRGESLLTMMFRSYMAAFQRELSGNGSSMTPDALFRAFESKDRARALKLLLAGELSQIESLMAGFDGPDGESAIVTDRNKVCIGVLEDELAEKGRRRIGIFYGGAHMPDMIARVKALGFEVRHHRFLTAWDCRSPEDRKREREKKEENL